MRKPMRFTDPFPAMSKDFVSGFRADNPDVQSCYLAIVITSDGTYDLRIHTSRDDDGTTLSTDLRSYAAAQRLADRVALDLAAYDGVQGAGPKVYREKVKWKAVEMETV